MFKNYFVTALRIFLGQKVYSIINIIGLSIGMAASLLIAVYILGELSYDRSSSDADRIYRVGVNETFQGQLIKYTDTGAPLAEAMRKDIPEVESSVRVSRFSNHLVQYKEKSFIENRFFLADSNFFKFFDYKLLEGNEENCLKGPHKIVISESTARRFFGYKGKGDISPIGKSIEVGTSHYATEVTGIVADVPYNTHLKFDMILSMDTWDYAVTNDCWACYGLHTYFKVNRTSSLPAVERKLGYFVEKNILPRIEQDLHVTAKQLYERGDKISFFVQPLTSIHLHSHFDNEFEPNGDIRYVNLFGAVALLTILIACINFMNLATARATSRLKEVAIRKTIGAAKSRLVHQFMIESFLYVLISTFLAGLLVFTMIEPFNLLTGKELNFGVLNSRFVLGGIALFVLAVAIISGSYPAFYLSAFKPIQILKGKMSTNVGHSVFRNGLVIFQFGISIALMISTLVIYKQLKFFQSQNLGFQKENVLLLAQAQSLGKNSRTFKNELLKHSEFSNASFASQLPPNIVNTLFIKAEGSEQLFSCYNSSVDYDLLQTMRFEMKSGRFFSRQYLSDSGAVIINETCAKIIGYDNFEEKTIGFGGKRKWRVIGIIKDFNFESLRTEIKPLVLFVSEDPEVMAIRFSPGNVTGKVKLAESIWKSFVPGLPFQYSFVDADFNRLFHSEQQMGMVFLVFTAMAIFIACLGLFGLVTFTSGRRTKEIGIRKVMGATITQITLLLSKELIRLVVISFMIAIPITWYGMNQWLQSFAYRTKFDFVLVIISGSIGVLIAVLTVSYKCYSAARRNPVASLKTE